MQSFIVPQNLALQNNPVLSQLFSTATVQQAPAVRHEVTSSVAAVATPGYILPADGGTGITALVRRVACLRVNHVSRSAVHDG